MLRPGATKPTKVSVRTLRRWLAAFQKNGFDGLRPTPRNDRGHGRKLPDFVKEMLMAIRKEYPGASTPLILEFLRKSEDQATREAAQNLAPATLNRFFRSLELRRFSTTKPTHSGERRKWNAANPGDVWHADVCHGIQCSVPGTGKTLPLRVHGILDDASRRVLTLCAASDEREVTMIDLLVRAIRRFGAPKMLYLDNGATYRGEMLELVCARLSIRLVHAKPYDPQARGKMERFWRTLREQCLSFIDSHKSHDDVQMDLQRFLDHTYHPRAHASLLGLSPNQVWGKARLRAVGEDEIAVALEVRRSVLVRNDGSVMHESQFYQVPKTFLCGKKAMLVTSLYDARRVYLEFEDIRYSLTRVDAVHNGLRGRGKDTAQQSLPAKTGFDPNALRKRLANSEGNGGAHE
jgi:transposase InsO family protein